MPSWNDIVYHTPPQPNQVRLDTTSVCNASCLSCHRFTTNRSGKMDINLIQEIIDDVGRWDTPLREVVPVNYGEFFTLPNWYQILSMISNKLPRTNIVLPTNGSMLNDERIDQLSRIQTLKVFNVSVNAYFDETYEAFMGFKAEVIPRIRQAVIRLKALRPDVMIWASMVADPMYCTDRERDLFKDYWGEVATPWILTASSANRPQKRPQIITKVPCRSIFSDLVIGFDRKLSSCCWDAGFRMDLDYYQGDVKKAWRNPKLEALRMAHNAHQRDKIDFCAGCTSG